MAQQPFLNAKDVAYDRPGSVAAYYGWQPENIGQFIQSATTVRPDGKNAKNAANVRSHMEKFLANRGVNMNSARPAQLVNALDYAYREEGRKQQTKGGGFLDFLKSMIGPVAGTALGFAVPVIGPALGGAIGGATQGGVEDGIKGALLGGLKGYGTGAGANWLAGKAGFAGGAAPIVDQSTSVAGGTAVGSGGTAVGGSNALGVAASGAGAGASVLDRFLDAAPAIGSGLAYLDATRGGASSAVPVAQRAEDDRRAIRARGVSKVDRAFANQDPYYDRLRSSIFDYHTSELDEDLTDQNRELKFELARRGQLGGSPEVDNAAELRRLYHRGRLDAGRIADEAVSRSRMADQNARAQAVSDVYMDVDSSHAVNNALGQSRVASQQAADFAKGQNVSDVFGNFAYLYQQGQQGKERRRGVADYYGGSVGVRPASNYYGST